MSIQKEVKYLDLANQFAKTFSKDKSSQVGALFLHPTEFTILSAGYNGIPRGCNDDVAARHERPLKYEYFEHAERNAIYNAVRSIFRGCTVVCTAPLDVDDIRALISVGVVALAARFLPSGGATRELLSEAGVRECAIPPDFAENSVLFFQPDKNIALARAAWLGLNPHDGVPEESAVRKAIFVAAEPLLRGSTLVVGPFPPCAVCARAVVAVGTRRVVTHKPTAEQDIRWGPSISQSRGIFRSLGVEMFET